jgi:hypothetical protein
MSREIKLIERKFRLREREREINKDLFEGFEG